MVTQIVLCAALLVVPGMELKTPGSTLALSQIPVEVECPTSLIFTDGEICMYDFENCTTGLRFTAGAVCDLVATGCPCENPVATVQMPGVQGNVARVRASDRPYFSGTKVTATAYVTDRPLAPKLENGYELLYHGPATLNAKGFRLLSIRNVETGVRYDVGHEVQGASQSTVLSYPTAKAVAVFGNDVQAEVRVAGEVRVFHLTCIGKSSVVGRQSGEPLSPVPDLTVPPIGLKHGLDYLQF